MAMRIPEIADLTPESPAPIIARQFPSLRNDAEPVDGREALAAPGTLPHHMPRPGMAALKNDGCPDKVAQDGSPKWRR